MPKYPTDPIAPVRKMLKLNAEDMVRVLIDCGSRDEQGRPRAGATFWCVACEEELRWNPGRGWFECVACGYELTTVEARALVERSGNVLGEMASRLASGYGRVVATAGQPEDSGSEMRQPEGGWRSWLNRLRGFRSRP